MNKQTTNSPKGSRAELVINIDMLKKKTVTIIGVGGTGSTVSNLLCRYPLKKIILIDGDIVENHNLDRQILYAKKDVSKKKAEVAKEKLHEFHQNVEIIPEFFNKETISKNIFEKIKKSDLIIDCSDNFETRSTLNDFCKKNKIPWIYSGAIKQMGQIFFVKNQGPCFKCFNNEKQNQKCKDFGVINSIVSLIASWTVSIALNYLSHGKIEDNLIRINLEDNSVIKLKINKKKGCCE